LPVYCTSGNQAKNLTFIYNRKTLISITAHHFRNLFKPGLAGQPDEGPVKEFEIQRLKVAQIWVRFRSVPGAPVLNLDYGSSQQQRAHATSSKVRCNRCDIDIICSRSAINCTPPLSLPAPTAHLGLTGLAIYEQRLIALPPYQPHRCKLQRQNIHVYERSLRLIVIDHINLVAWGQWWFIKIIRNL